MSRFDKLKIRVSIDAISRYDNEDFKPTYSKNILRGYKYRHPQFNLCIIVNTHKMKPDVTIEFTGKLLGELYPSLINKNNIRVCLSNINKLGICLIDVDKVIENGEICKCDITADIPNVEISKLEDLAQCYRSSKSWVINPYRNGGFVISNSVVSDDCKRRLSVYNKEREMKLAKNIRFLAGLANRDEVAKYFEGRTRFEMNLTSKKAIKTVFHITDTKIATVLSSTANPIRDTFLKAIELPTEASDIKTARDFARLMVLIKFDYDLIKIKSRLKPFYKTANGLNKTIKEYGKIASAKRPIDFAWLERIFEQCA